MADDLAEMYRATYDALVRFLYRKVWDAERAADLARALVHRPANARGWLFVVAANLARDEGRRRLRERRHLTLLKAEPETTGEHAEPEEAMDLEARRARVRAALEELTPRDREVLLLWDAGLPYEEIAAQTGLAPGAVGTTLARARRRLVEAYEAGSEETHVAR